MLPSLSLHSSVNAWVLKRHINLLNLPTDSTSTDESPHKDSVTSLQSSVTSAANLVRAHYREMESLPTSTVEGPKCGDFQQSSFSDVLRAEIRRLRTDAVVAKPSTELKNDPRPECDSMASCSFGLRRFSTAGSHSEWRTKVEEAERARESAQNKLRHQRREASRRERSLREGLAEANAALQQTRGEAERWRKELAQATSATATATEKQQKQRSRERALRRSTEDLRVCTCMPASY